MLDSVLQEILTEPQKMNARLGDIREELTDIKQAQGDDALSVVAAKLDELKGYGTFNSISDVCHNLSQIDRRHKAVKCAYKPGRGVRQGAF